MRGCTHCTVDVQSDNCTAVSYILQKGSTHTLKLMELTYQLLHLTDGWCFTFAHCTSQGWSLLRQMCNYVVEEAEE